MDLTNVIELVKIVSTHINPRMGGLSEDRRKLNGIFFLRQEENLFLREIV
jgi:hypothetical protein